MDTLDVAVAMMRGIEGVRTSRRARRSFVTVRGAKLLFPRYSRGLRTVGRDYSTPSHICGLPVVFGRLSRQGDLP